jgi:hypothetical protein
MSENALRCLALLVRSYADLAALVQSEDQTDPAELVELLEIIERAAAVGARGLDLEPWLPAGSEAMQ